jgi:hypothetical protein
MTTSEIKVHKVLSPSEMLDTLDAIRDVQAEVVCHVQTWLHHPRPEVDERFIAARNREAAMLEQIMTFDRRNWNKGRPPADEALLKAEALAKRRRRRAEQAVQRRYHSAAPDQPEGEGL